MRVAVSVLVAAILCGGCSRKVTAVMAESHENSHDSVAAVSAIRDTLILRDSVATFISGDTVYVRSASVRERLRTVTDTLVRTRRDTVTVIREITPLPPLGKRHPVSRPRHRWFLRQSPSSLSS